MSKRESGKWTSALCRSLTLDERIHLLAGSRQKQLSSRQSVRAKKVIKAWKKRKPFSISDAFQKRLKDLAIDELTLARAIAMPVDQATRTYVRQKKIWDDYRTIVGTDRNDAVSSDSAEDDHWGMVRLVRPLVEQSMQTFRSKLETLLCIDLGGLLNLDKICLKVEQGVIKHILGIIQRTCLLELKVAKLSGLLHGNTSQERYKSYLRLLEDPQFSSRLFLEYPVLLGVVSTRLDFYCRNALDLVTRLLKDREQIESHIFCGNRLHSLEDWKLGQGDSHCNGSTVATLKFSDGRHLVYKPRSLSVDLGFNRVVRWCNDRVPSFPLRTVRTLDCGSHGWCEYMEHREIESGEEIRAFFYRQGKFIALFYALHASDLHYENMIARGADPVYIDLETLFHAPPWLNFVVNAPQAAIPPGATVINTLILPPGRKISNNSPTLDVSIFGADPGQELPEEVLELAEPGSDEMHLRGRKGFLNASAHLPMYQGKAVPWDGYVSAVVEGFVELYEFFERESSSLNEQLSLAFADAKFRLVVRHTALYSSIIHSSLHPDYLRDELERHALFERLFSVTADSRWANKLLGAEMRDMAELDVPYFYRAFDGDGFFDSKGNEVAGVHLSSPRVIAERQLSRLCRDDMHAQIRLIEQSLSSKTVELSAVPIKIRHLKAEGGTSAPLLDPIDEAVGIADTLARHLVKSGGDNYWMCQTLERESLAVTSPDIIDLYEGQLGIILFFGTLSAVTGLDKHEDIAMRGLDTVRRWTQSGLAGFQSHGVYTGSMGYAYVLANLGLGLKKAYLLDEALAWIAGFDPERDEDGLDVVDGAAGCVLFLAQLLEVPHIVGKCRDTIRGLVDFFARRIVAEAKKEAVGVSWRIPKKPEVAQIGFAHGNAGFAAALYVSARALGQEKYREVGRAALLFENSRYSSAHCGWHDLSLGPSAAHGAGSECAWCRGAPGIALSRLIALESVHHDTAARELLIADLMHGIDAMAVPQDSDNSSLCHGTFGNQEIFSMAQKFISRHGISQCDAKWGARATDIPMRRCGDPGRNLVDSYNASQGLMTGVAGIGYGLLRAAAPERVPSVIRLALVGVV